MKNHLAVKRIVSGMLIAAISIFFYFEFKRNASELSHITLTFNAVFIVFGFLCICANYLITTLAWQLLIAETAQCRLTFLQSVACVNTSQLGKYLPGKIWTYALQAYWLSIQNVPVTTTVYVGVTVTACSLLSATWTAASVLLFVPPMGISMTARIIIWASITVTYLLFLLMSSHVITFVSYVLSRTIKRDIRWSVSVPTRHLLWSQLLFIPSALFFACGGVFVVYGCGFTFQFPEQLAFGAALNLADSVGFLVLIVPGGFGVREGVLYSLLTAASFPASIALVAPIAVRIVTMTADFAVGGFGLVVGKIFHVL